MRHNVFFSFCAIMRACVVSSVKVLDVNARESVGWSGRSPTFINGARSSAHGELVCELLLCGCRVRTFKLHIIVRVELICSRLSFSVLVVFARHFVAIVVVQWWSFA